MGTPRELAPETWDEYFDAVGRELMHAPVSIDAPGTGQAEQLERLSLIALRQDRLELALSRGEEPIPDAVRTLILHPRRVAIDNQTLLAPMTIAVDGQDGTRTLIHFEREPEPVS